jgi:predicted nucleotidyltransferase
MWLTRLIRALDREKLDYALVGGVAVALHGAVRGTVDVDLVLKLNRRDFLTAERVFQNLGLQSKLPVTAAEVFDFRLEYIKNRNLTAWSFTNPQNPLEIVDVIITHDLNQMKKRIIPFEGLKIKILALDDLIKMKSGTGRKQDQEDIKALKFIKGRK